MIPIGFEYGFRKALHVVNTRPTDWEQPSLDLTDFITRLNNLKVKYQVFHEECPTQLVELDNRSVLVLGKGSTKSREEALIVLNTNISERQAFYVDKLRRLMQSQAPLTCVSPENPLNHISEPFHYELRPGEALAFVTQR